MKLNLDNHYTIEYKSNIDKTLYSGLSSWISDRNKEIAGWLDANLDAKSRLETHHDRSVIEIVKDTLAGANVDLDKLHSVSILPCDFVFYNIVADGSYNGETNELTDTVAVSFLKYAPKSDINRYPDLDALRNFAFGWLVDCVSDTGATISTDVDCFDGNYMKVSFLINNVDRLKHC